MKGCQEVIDTKISVNPFVFQKRPSETIVCSQSVKITENIAECGRHREMRSRKEVRCFLKFCFSKIPDLREKSNLIMI